MSEKLPVRPGMKYLGRIQKTDTGKGPRWGCLCCPYVATASTMLALLESANDHGTVCPATRILTS